MIKESLKKISIRDLYENMAFSMRTLNCCAYAELYTLYDIMAYYQSGKSFMELRKAEPKVSLELESLCKEAVSQPESVENRYRPIKEDPQEIIKYNRKSEVARLIENDLLATLHQRLISPSELWDYLSPLKKFLAEKSIKNLWHLVLQG